MIALWITFLCLLSMHDKTNAVLNSSTPFRIAQVEELFRVLYGSKPLFLVRRNNNQWEEYKEDS